MFRAWGLGLRVGGFEGLGASGLRVLGCTGFRIQGVGPIQSLNPRGVVWDSTSHV